MGLNVTLKPWLALVHPAFVDEVDIGERKKNSYRLPNRKSLIQTLTSLLTSKQRFRINVGCFTLFKKLSWARGVNSFLLDLFFSSSFLPFILDLLSSKGKVSKVLLGQEKEVSLSGMHSFYLKYLLK